ncbi:hypothetical protein HN903_03575 [archaeon]|jgi:hypothetical protein|nr:hypothetical protein [archaeon]MBT7128809.1 hypothetical protein [archaeon]
MGVEEIIGLDESAEFDGKNIWVAVDGQYNWANKEVGGHGFIYRNFVGSSKTKFGVVEHVRHKLNFLGMEVVVRQNEGDFTELVSEAKNYRVRIFKYDLDGPSMFDVNH